MSIEWFRDLSIVILGFVATAVLIFTAILVYRLYRTLTTTLLLVKEVSEITLDTVTLMHKGPLAMILVLIQGIREGFHGINKVFKKESK